MERYLLVACTRPMADADDAFNEWYNEVHLSEVLNVKGFQAAQRFALAQVMINASDTPSPYMAIYEILTDDIAGTLADLRSALPGMTIDQALDQSATSAVAYRPLGDRVTTEDLASGPSSMDVFEAMGTARSMRRLRSEPLDDELVERLIWAATRASSANNTQPWDFVVVRDRDQKRRIGEVIAPIADKLESRYATSDDVARRRIKDASELARNISEAPALIFVCGTNSYPEKRPRAEWMYSAVYGAAQNLIVAARALGLGAAYTTLHDAGELAIREVLGIPEDRTLAVTIAVGYPARPFGPVSRRPVEEVIHLEKW